MDVVIQRAENPSQQPTQVKKKRKVLGFLYCAQAFWARGSFPQSDKYPQAHYFKGLTQSMGFWGLGHTKMKTFLWLRQSMG